MTPVWLCVVRRVGEGGILQAAARRPVYPTDGGRLSDESLNSDFADGMYYYIILYSCVVFFFFLHSELVFPKPPRPFLEIVHSIKFFFRTKSFTQNLQRSVYVYLYTIAHCTAYGWPRIFSANEWLFKGRWWDGVIDRHNALSDINNLYKVVPMWLRFPEVYSSVNLYIGYTTSVACVYAGRIH